MIVYDNTTREQCSSIGDKDLFGSGGLACTVSVECRCLWRMKGVKPSGKAETAAGSAGAVS